MTTSTTSGKKIKRIIINATVIAFWLLVWHLVSVALSQEILLVSPVKVAIRLFDLVLEKNFWVSIGNSLFNVFFGFFAAILVGVFTACINARFVTIKTILDPVLSLIKSIPVASFAVLALLWVKSYRLSLFISFLMVLPIIYSNVYAGIINTDEKLLDMAKVFRVKAFRKITGIYIPSVLPYFLSSCTIGVGFAWKSGVAAEVISLPSKSIGMNIYNAKIYLENADLLSWTIVTILLSVLVEKVFVALVIALKRSTRRL